MKKVEKKLRRVVSRIHYKLLLPTLSLSFFCVLLALYDKEILKQIEVGNVAAWVKTIENLATPILSFFDFGLVKALAVMLFTSLLLLTLCKVFLRPKAIVISHSSFSNTQAPYDQKAVSNYLVAHKDINLVDKMKRHDFVDAIRTQDRLVSEITNKCDEFTQLFYYGIAHIPLIVRAGYQIGNEGTVRLLHKFRNDQSLFKELSSESDDYRINIAKRLTPRNLLADELLVVIATSLEVTDADLAILRKSNIKYELNFHIADASMYDFDVLSAYATMTRLRTVVMAEIRKQVKKENINRIHLVLATSSDFAFYLAQDFSATHDPEIITYHYESSSNVKYPWGISNKLPPATAMVILRDTTENVN